MKADSKNRQILKIFSTGCVVNGSSYASNEQLDPSSLSPYRVLVNKIICIVYFRIIGIACIYTIDTICALVLITLKRESVHNTYYKMLTLICLLSFLGIHWITAKSSSLMHHRIYFQRLHYEVRASNTFTASSGCPAFLNAT